ncbi:hypothetical protein [Sporolactobacillus shoreae]
MGYGHANDLSSRDLQFKMSQGLLEKILTGFVLLVPINGESDT